MKAKDILVPTITLALIALVCSGLLVGTNEVTAETIEELQIESDNESRAAVLPEADAFDDGQTIVIDEEEYTYWTADNGAGYVFSTSYKGYGGAVVVMTGITADGEISGVEITEQDETPGLGQRALEDEFRDQYVGEIPEEEFTVTKTGSTADNEIDALSGATITSTAVTNSVNMAVTIYETITGGAD